MEKVLKNFNEYMLYLSAKSGDNNFHSKNTVKKWLQMFNFDLFPKWNNISTATGIIAGYVYNLFFLFDLKFFTWEYFIKGLLGLLFAITCAAMVRIINIFVDMKIKPIIQNFHIKRKNKK